MNHDNANLQSASEAAVGSTDNVVPQAGDDFVLTEAVHRVAQRAMTYLEIGYPVHLAGPAGTGKTTLAFHIAAMVGRPVTLMHGNDEFGAGDMIGKDNGYRKTTVIDNYVRSVKKIDENLAVNWTDNRLTIACQQGHTLIYDEFNRTRAEANNTLLSVLEERILVLPGRSGGVDSYVNVHPDFRVIFTSNPEEYAGVHKTQDALLDRLITIEVGHYDRETEVQIASAKGNLAIEDAAYVVDVVRKIRELRVTRHLPTVRASIAICRILAHKQLAPTPDDSFFSSVLCDVLGDRGTGYARDNPAADAIVRTAREMFATRERGVVRGAPRTLRAISEAA